MACDPTFIGKFVNTYLIDRAYGGPEEGGWWYNTGEAVESRQFPTLVAAERYREVRLGWCSEENRQRRSDISSVLSQGRYVVCVEDWPAADYPAQRPHYE